MSYAETTIYGSDLVVGTAKQVVAIASPTGYVRVYDPTLGLGDPGSNANAANLPTLTPYKQIIQETQNVLPEDDNTSDVDGNFYCSLVASASDTVNGTSVTAPVQIAASDRLIVATGTNT